MTQSNTVRGLLCIVPLVPAIAIPGVGVLGSLLLVILTLVFVRDARAPTLAMIQHSVARSILIGIFAGFAIAVAFDFLVEPFVESLTGDAIDLENFAAVEGNVVNFLALLAVGLLFGGIVEELIFRGFVIGWGAHIFGARMAIPLAVLSATVFGAAHLYQGLAGTITTGLTGLLFGLLYIACGRNLLPAIVAHMTVNAYGVTLIYLGMA